MRKNKVNDIIGHAGYGPLDHILIWTTARTALPASSYHATDPWTFTSGNEIYSCSSGRGSKQSFGSGAEYTGGVSSMVGRPTYPHNKTKLKLYLKLLESCTVICQISPYAFELDLPATIQIHCIHPVSHLDLVVDDPLAGQQVEPQPPAEVDDEEEHQASGVQVSWVYQNHLQYLIR